MRFILRTLGFLALACGILFVLQGAGLVHWPPESFMLDQRPWIYKGAAIVVAGAALLFVARRF